ncbi:cupin-like domain-containing protein [Streptomyces sp. NPDC059802]|uniref:cupin-like domain-containing protein n=1 Tax=Streptomyces sp. NPDC059802 TaxID=3346952 RepID=UPI0036613DCA
MARKVVSELDAHTFAHEYLGPNRPVLVRGALASASWTPPWSLDSLIERFGDRKVALTDTLFAIIRFSTLAQYAARYTGEGVKGIPLYLRWFVRQNTREVPWADEVFEGLADDWAMPSWLPDRDYVFPESTGPIDAARDPFPAKGLFICGRGGRTRLHTDPWATDACLCQVTGTKQLIMYPPGTDEFLGPDGQVVDLDAPDEGMFPRWRQAVPAFDEVLRPGDAAFIPSGWYHTAIALEDSVSITWNFVHRTHASRFEEYLRSGGSEDSTVRYFLGLDADDA